MPVNIFAGGGYTTNKVFKYDTSLSKLGESPNYGSTTDGIITSIHNDETYLYITGGDKSTGVQTAQKIRISDMALITSTPAYGTFQIKFGYLLNGYYYLCGPYILKIFKYDTSDMSKVGESAALTNTIQSYTSDGTYLYASTYMSILKYDTSDLSILATSPDYGTSGSTIYSLTNDASYIYAGGQGTNRVRKYNISDLTYVSQSAYLTTTVQALYHDGSFIYAGAGQYIYKVNPSDMSTAATSPAYGGNIQGITGDGTYIYAGGGTTNKVFKYDPSDLSKITESAAYDTASLRVLNVFAKTFFTKGLTETVSTARTARRRSNKNQLQKITRASGTVNRRLIFNKLLTDTISALSTARRQAGKRLTEIINASRNARRHINRTLNEIVRTTREARRRTFKAFTKGIKAAASFITEYIFGAIQKTLVTGAKTTGSLIRRSYKTLVETLSATGTKLAGLPAPVLDAIQNITGCLYLTWT